MGPMSKDERAILDFLFRHKDEEGNTSLVAICDGTGLSRQVVRRTLRSLQEQNMVGGPPNLYDQSVNLFKEMEPKFNPTDSGFNEHIILVASIIEKAEEGFLADELSFDAEFVGLVGSRLRQAGIWAGAAVAKRFYDAIMKDSLNFWLAGAVATGDLMIVGQNEMGDDMFKMTDSGLAAGAKLIKHLTRKKSQPE